MKDRTLKLLKANITAKDFKICRHHYLFNLQSIKLLCIKYLFIAFENYNIKMYSSSLVIKQYHIF